MSCQSILDAQGIDSICTSGKWYAKTCPRVNGVFVVQCCGLFVYVREHGYIFANPSSHKFSLSRPIKKSCAWWDSYFDDDVLSKHKWKCTGLLSSILAREMARLMPIVLGLAGAFGLGAWAIVRLQYEWTLLPIWGSSMISWLGLLVLLVIGFGGMVWLRGSHTETSRHRWGIAWPCDQLHARDCWALCVLTYQYADRVF